MKRQRENLLIEIADAAREVVRIAHDLDSYKAGDRWSFTGLDDFTLRRGAAYQQLERLVQALDAEEGAP